MTISRDPDVYSLDIQGSGCQSSHVRSRGILTLDTPILGTEKRLDEIGTARQPILISDDDLDSEKLDKDLSAIDPLLAQDNPPRHDQTSVGAGILSLVSAAWDRYITGARDTAAEQTSAAEQGNGTTDDLYAPIATRTRGKTKLCQGMSGTSDGEDTTALGNIIHSVQSDSRHC
ncbi:hypothetical protein EC973_001461 [Apophysomyces ossiformis]|uniref:Uncharacterized protein n=1 Tax=Apophysomyces ossiformis TaxID=679940 RepID=A0A8H7BKB5_9FUNG|nr:hypothetical protein EC973_001461 [Apophysomyces ossiformis]